MEFDVTEEGINSIQTEMGSKLVEDSGTLQSTGYGPHGNISLAYLSIVQFENNLTDDLTERCRFCGEESSPSEAPVDHCVVSLLKSSLKYIL